MQKQKATERISFRVPDTLKAEIEQRAAEEGRTASNLIINIVSDYLKKINDAKKLLNSK